ncbi:MAG: hypothetical protein GX840_03620 [Bacteroidales bacterium]|jgi:hypothetical protein|nr:hypothetical protein [Bacteroidales bacterium]
MKTKSNKFRLLCLTLLLLIGASGLHAQVDYLCFTADEAGYVRLSVTGSITANIQNSDLHGRCQLDCLHLWYGY